MSNNKPIIIDPGHGGHDPGAIGPGGMQEKEIALAVSLEIHRQLTAQDFPARCTRTDDTFRPLSWRAQFANERNSALLVSIHLNAGGGTGFEVFTSPGQTRSDQAATAIISSMRQEGPYADQRARLDLADGDPDKEARFTVLTKTTGPAVLVELGFIDTSEEFFSSHSFAALAAPIVRGILAFLLAEEVAANKAAPPPPGTPRTLEQRVSRLEKRVFP